MEQDSRLRGDVSGRGWEDVSCAVERVADHRLHWIPLRVIVMAQLG